MINLDEIDEYLSSFKIQKFNALPLAFSCCKQPYLIYFKNFGCSLEDVYKMFEKFMWNEEYTTEVFNNNSFKNDDDKERIFKELISIYNKNLDFYELIRENYKIDSESEIIAMNLLIKNTPYTKTFKDAFISSLNRRINIDILIHIIIMFNIADSELYDNDCMTHDSPITIILNSYKKDINLDLNHMTYTDYYETKNAIGYLICDEYATINGKIDFKFVNFVLDKNIFNIDDEISSFMYKISDIKYFMHKMQISYIDKNGLPHDYFTYKKAYFCNKKTFIPCNDLIFIFKNQEN